MTKSTELTLPQRAAVALGSAEHEAKLKELAAKNADIVEIKNGAGRDQCHSAMMVLANARVTITKSGKEAREDATKFSKAVIEEEKRLIAIIEPEESRLRGLRDEWDAERERERQAKAEAEKARIAGLQERIAEIRGAVAAVAHCSSALVLEHIGDIERIPVDATFEEFQGQAQLAKDETLDKLRELHAAAVAREEEAARLKAEQEAEAARLAAEREELAQLRAEAEAREREAAAARAAQEEADRKARAEQERRDREAREEQERAMAEANRVAREKLAAEEAEMRATRAAEEKRIAAERAELQRQQDELAAQRRREADIAAAKQRDADLAAAKAIKEQVEAAARARAAAEAADTLMRNAAQQMLDALRQWRYAEQTNDAAELENARRARDEAIEAADPAPVPADIAEFDDQDIPY